MSDLEKLKELLNYQAKNSKDRNTQTVAMHLQSIAEITPSAVPLLLQDLPQSGMGIADAEKRIKAAYEKVGFLTPYESDCVLRKFYGIEDLPDNVFIPGRPMEQLYKTETPKHKTLDLADFL